MLILKQEDYNKIVDHAKKGLPNEACGLLGGYVEGDKRVVTDVRSEERRVGKECRSRWSPYH